MISAYFRSNSTNFEKSKKKKEIRFRFIFKKIKFSLKKIKIAALDEKYILDKKDSTFLDQFHFLS